MADLHDIKLEEGSSGAAVCVFKTDAVVFVDVNEKSRASSLLLCPPSFLRRRWRALSRRTKWLVVLAGVLAAALVVLHSRGVTPALKQHQVDSPKPHDKDASYYEKETKVIEKQPPNPTYVREPQCIAFGASTVITPSQAAAAVTWNSTGEELTKVIKGYQKANNGVNSKFSDQFGYGHAIALSGDGLRMAVPYEGTAGFDRTFGMHVDVFHFNSTDGSWDHVQTLTDVTRGHGHAQRVRFQALAMSTNGNRIAFSDGHGVAIFEYDEDAAHRQAEGGDKQKLWIQLDPIMDPVEQLELTDDSVHEQFGTDLALNCDGSVMAVSGMAVGHSYTKLYQEERQGVGNDISWIETGEIQGIKFGGSIALNLKGSRLVMSTVASEGWRGMVQVWERNTGASWSRVGQPIVGEKPLEMWGGRVAVSADGETLVITAKHGDTNRVAAYRVEPDSGLWEQYGPVLNGNDSMYEHFGADVALSNDGTILAVGAPGDHDLFEAEQEGKEIPAKNQPFLKGRIYLFRLDSVGSRKQQGRMKWIKIGDVGNEVRGDTYGSSVALSADGSRVAGGAPRRTGKAYQQLLGSARAFHATATLAH